MQPGDVPMTWADTSELQEDFEYQPATPVEEGIGKFIEWYQSYYQIKAADHKPINGRSKISEAPQHNSAKASKTHIHE